MQLIFGLVCATVDEEINFTSDGNLSWIFTVVIASLLENLCLPCTLTLAPATLVAPIDLLRLPLIAIAGFHILGKTTNL